MKVLRSKNLICEPVKSSRGLIVTLKKGSLRIGSKIMFRGREYKIEQKMYLKGFGCDFELV